MFRFLPAIDYVQIKVLQLSAAHPSIPLLSLVWVLVGLLLGCPIFWPTQWYTQIQGMGKRTVRVDDAIPQHARTRLLSFHAKARLMLSSDAQSPARRSCPQRPQLSELYHCSPPHDFLRWERHAWASLFAALFPLNQSTKTLVLFAWMLGL